MKYLLKFVCICSAIIMSGCSKDNIDSLENFDDAFSINANMINYSKNDEQVEKIPFIKGNIISLNMWKDIYSKSNSVCSNIKYINSDSKIWKRVDNNEVRIDYNCDKYNFAALYPSKDVNDLTSLTITKDDESQLIACSEIKSDVLKNEKTLDLDFKHLFAKINLSLTNSSAYENFTVKKITIVNANEEATINLTNRLLTATKKGDIDFDVDKLTASKCIMPQNGITIKLTADYTGTTDKSFPLSSEIEIKSGKKYDLDLDLNNGKLELKSINVSEWGVGNEYFATLQEDIELNSHPIIFATSQDRDAIVEKINNKTWAKEAYLKIKSIVDDDVNAHISTPDKILTGLPQIPDNNTNSETVSSSAAATNAKVLEKAAYSSIVYYVTKEEKYAQFSADILQYYFDNLSSRTASTTTICGCQFYDSRIGYNHLAVAYDFIYPFLMNKGIKVYSKSSNSRVEYDDDKAQKVIVNIAKSAMKYGSTDNKYGKDISNHAVLTSPGALFPILCIKDETLKKELFNIFWVQGTSVQNSFTKTILPMFGEQGIWPESVSYSFMPNISMILNIVDRIYPEEKILLSFKNIFEGNFLFENLRIPNGKFVRYGDSHRENDATENLYIITNNMALRNKDSELTNKSEAAMSNYYANNGGLKSNIAISTYDNYYPYIQLFWGNHDHPIEVNDDIMKPTVLIKHAGIALQRNYVKDDNKDYGLCGIIGGAYYVHNHLTGITMELYGGGDVMCANGGLPTTLADRNIDLHTKYFSRYAGNNTVVVNGSALGSNKMAWKSNGYSWQNSVNTISCEPNHLQEPINKKFSFATGYFDDTNNNCKQERTLGIVRLDDKSAYYIDIFRSKSNSSNNYHDYLYHNIGDKTNVMDINDNALSLNQTSIYSGDLGDSFKTPGWYFYESAKTTGEINKAVKVRFDLSSTNRYMFMFMPAQTERQYTYALAPATREALNGYVNKKTQVIAVRQTGEAWNRPFISIFEPSLSTQSVVKDVANILSKDKIVGVKVKSQIGTKIYENYIFCNDNSDDVYDDVTNGIYFKGRYGIIQLEKNNDSIVSIELYIGDGETIKYNDKTLNATNRKGSVKF